MKTILVLCDGTWNSPTIPEPTHVVELRDAAVDDAGQKVIYIPGVGARDGVKGMLNKVIDKIGGGAFGWGLAANVRSAYQQLANAYEQGDDIMIFGFSRGAFTAQALAGMLRKCGLPTGPGVTMRQVRRAFRLYQRKQDQDHPDSPHIMYERLCVSPDYATSDKDIAWRKERQASDTSFKLRVAYLGVWDTVGALGLPESVFGMNILSRGLARLWNGRYQFYDNDLTSMVKSARHAVAVGERREIFKPSLWVNLDQSGGDPAKGLNGGDTSDTRPFQQQFFVGNHSVVGGSSAPNKPISAITLKWIVEGAGGLRLRDGVDLPADTPDPTHRGFEVEAVFPPWDITPQSWREDPDMLCECHPSVVERMWAFVRYRPEPVRHLWP